MRSIREGGLPRLACAASLCIGLCFGCSESGEPPVPAPPAKTSAAPGDTADDAEIADLFERLLRTDRGLCGNGVASARSTRERAHEELVELGPAALPAITERLGSGDPPLRAALLRVLVELGPEGRAVLEDEAIEGRQDALVALGGVDPVPQLAVELTMQALDREAPMERWLTSLLGRICGDETQSRAIRLRAVDELLEIAGSDEMHERANAIGSLSPVPTREDAALRILRTSARGPDRWGIRHYALAALERFDGPRAAEIAAIYVRSGYESERALRLLLGLGADAQPARAAAIRAMNTRDDRVAVLAIRVIGNTTPVGNRAAMRRLLRILDPQRPGGYARSEAATATAGVGGRSDLRRLEELAVFYRRVGIGDTLAQSANSIRRRNGMDPFVMPLEPFEAATQPELPR